MYKKHYDVIVIGAGTAGCIAALQAARAGAQTLLVEKNGLPGGTMTSGGVNFPGLFHAWGHQVIAGIGWELVKKCVDAENGSLPDSSDYEQPHWRLQIKINGPLYACLMDEALETAGVDTCYHAMTAAVKEQHDMVTVSLCLREGLRDFTASILIDASGDAEAIELAGYSLRRSQNKQPATPMLRFGGYDHSKIDTAMLEKAYFQALKDGKLRRNDTGISGSIIHLINQYGENCIHIAVDDPTTSSGKSRAEIYGRASILRLYRFLRDQPGFENLHIEYMAPECGIREGATIIGESTITVEDYEQGRSWDDSLCYSFYPIDLHLDTEEGLLYRKLQKDIVPTIPRAAMIPTGSRRILAAGRCISSDQLANSALRVQASCMATGQTAGALAAMAAKGQTIPVELEIAAVKELLRKHNAIVP